MRRLLRQRPSPALVLAAIALFVALGGVGYAALSLPRESVTARHLARGSVKSAEIARNAVKRSEIARAAVTSADVRNGTLQAADLAASAQPLSGYAAYLQPNGAGRTVNVGWQSDDVRPSGLTYSGSGRYLITFERTDGLGCAVPVATAFQPGADVTMRVVGLSCNASETFFELATSTGTDVEFLLQVDFTS